MYQPSYEDKCRQHATAQGLDPICARLRQTGFKPQLLQTGGFVMVAEAFYNSQIQILVTHEGDGPQDDRPYLIGVYPRHAKDDEWLAYQYCSLEELPQSVRKFSEQEAW
jgi:hypothetical protein